MGHIINKDKEYRLLQQRLDQNITGAPDSPTLTKILKILFSPEEAALAARLPTNLNTAASLAKILNIEKKELEDKLSSFAQRGLVIDIEHNNDRYFSLSPVVIGFFEYTFMRTRDEVPMKELAQLFHDYMKNEDLFARSIFQGETQIGRALPHEESIVNGDHSEILDWERASYIVAHAEQVGVSMCSCRHKAHHLNKACDRPLNNCLSLNYGAKSLISSGLAKPISNQDGLRLLEEAKSMGLVQTGDNVKKSLTYICNCCGCCCGMLSAINTFNINNAIVSSNYIMQCDDSKCNGCGKCAKDCPIDAIAMIHEERNSNPKNKKNKWTKLEKELCLGCGVCYQSCKTGAISLVPRMQKVFTPETTFDRIIAMAIERGKLSQLIMEKSDNLGYMALGRIIQTIEKLPAFKAAMAVKPLKSIFLNRIVNEAKKMSGDVGKIFY